MIGGPQTKIYPFCHFIIFYLKISFFSTLLVVSYTHNIYLYKSMKIIMSVISKYLWMFVICLCHHWTGVEIWLFWEKILWNDKSVISRSVGLQSKNKTTLFPETLKVEENKVVLFFWLKAPRRIYEGFFVLSKILNFIGTFSNQKLIFGGKSIK